MAISLHSNLLSLSAQRHLAHSQRQSSAATERLSSGKRINSSRDDAAGIAVASRLGVRASGLGIGLRNANEAVSLLQTAGSALEDVSRGLLRLRDLAVQSANGSYGAGDRQALQQEAAQILEEVGRLAGQTHYRGERLLDGSAGMLEFQLGSSLGEHVRLEGLPDIRLQSLGSNSMQLDGTLMGTALTPGTSTPFFGFAPEIDLVLETALGGATAPISVTTTGIVGASNIAAAIDKAASGTGISAKAYSSATLSQLSAAGTVSFTLGFEAAPIVADIADPDDLTALVDAINAAPVALTARFADLGDKSKLVIEDTKRGRSIKIENFASTAAGNQTVMLAGERGAPVTLTEGGNDSSVVHGQVTLTSTRGPITARNANPDMFSTITSGSLAGFSIATVADAGKGLAVLDGALEQVSGYRSNLGARLNRLESVTNSLATGADALVTARGRVEDADYAVETASLMRSQILQQAGIAMLAQANAQPRDVLRLLRA